MNELLISIVAPSNKLANALGGFLLQPVAVLPGWLSATLIATATGIVLLFLFKYTSNQRAIERARNQISANLLALKLFKESAGVAVAAQGRIMKAAVRLFLLSLVPMLIMMLPVTLILAQVGLWYQTRPLAIGEQSVVTVTLGGDADAQFPAVKLRPNPAVEVEVGPVRSLATRQLFYRIKAVQAGTHLLVFDVADRAFDKQLTIGSGYLRTSAIRPGWDWSEILLNPAEEPFEPNCVLRSITIAYPSRSSWITGTDWWIAYWFVVSMAAALLFRKALGVHL